MGISPHALGTGPEGAGPYPGVPQAGVEPRAGAGLGSVSRPGQEHGGPATAGGRETEAAAWGLLGLAASPEEEGAGQEAGEGAERGRAKRLAVLEATWLVGQGVQGLDHEAQQPARCQPGGGPGVPV